MRTLWLVALVVLAPGCKDVLKSDDAETQIRAYLDKAAPGKVSSVECPDDIEMKQGNNFTCKAKVDGLDITVDVEQKDGKGNVYYESKNMIINKSIEDAIVAKMKESKLEGTASCGPTALRLVRKGDMFDCAITTADGKTDKLRIEIMDDSGRWQAASAASPTP